MRRNLSSQGKLRRKEEADRASHCSAHAGLVHCAREGKERGKKGYF